jgi:hypothetical protein
MATIAHGGSSRHKGDFFRNGLTVMKEEIKWPNDPTKPPTLVQTNNHVMFSFCKKKCEGNMFLFYSKEFQYTSQLSRVIQIETVV